MAAGDLLGLLVRVNLSAAAAIVAVLVLRPVVRSRFGAQLAYALWIVPLLAAGAALIPARHEVLPAPQTTAPATAADLLFTGLPLPEGPANPLDLSVLAITVWVAGIAVAAVAMIHLQRRFAAEARRGAIGPAVVGLITPRIVTPADFEQKFTPEERALVIAHERTHITRQDCRTNALSAALQCLFWFNPLVHLAAHMMRIDQELACDAAVVTRFPEGRRAYAQALVKAQLAIRPLPLGCYWPSGTEHPLLERIAMLKTADIGKTRRLLGGTALTLLCTAAGLAAWAAKPVEITYEAAAATAPETATMAAPLAAPIDTSEAAEAPAGPTFTDVAEAEATQDIAVPLQTPPTPLQPPGGTFPTLQTALTDAEASGTPVTVEGSIARVEWINPQTILTIVDANGQEMRVASETPNTLLRQGINRAALGAGQPISISGYRGANGVVQARGAGMSRNGQPLAVNDPYGNPLAGAPAAPQGAVIQQSPLTNSVIRQGDPRAQ